jgi:hypothetical protein
VPEIVVEVLDPEARLFGEELFGAERPAVDTIDVPGIQFEGAVEEVFRRESVREIAAVRIDGLDADAVVVRIAELADVLDVHIRVVVDVLLKSRADAAAQVVRRSRGFACQILIVAHLVSSLIS